MAFVKDLNFTLGNLTFSKKNTKVNNIINNIGIILRSEELSKQHNDTVSPAFLWKSLHLAMTY